MGKAKEEKHVKRLVGKAKTTRLLYFAFWALRDKWVRQASKSKPKWVRQILINPVTQAHRMGIGIHTLGDSQILIYVLLNLVFFLALQRLCTACVARLTSTLLLIFVISYFCLFMLIIFIM